MPMNESSLKSAANDIDQPHAGQNTQLYKHNKGNQGAYLTDKREFVPKTMEMQSSRWHREESPELYEPTILDVLNEHCWHAVLDYLDIDDLVRSERVSRRWQQMVHEYLPGVTCYYYGSKQPTYKHYRRIKLKMNVGHEGGQKLLFREMLDKLSPYIVKFFLGFARSWLFTKIKITFEMDKLEDLTLYHMEPGFIENGDFTNCKRLKRVAFESCSLIHDHHVEKFISNLDIDELSIKEAHNISGEFLINLKSNIKYLTLTKCWDLEFFNLLNGSQILSQLKKFELNSNPLIDIDDLRIIVTKMPKVESLSLNGYKQRNRAPLVNVLVVAVGKLTELKEFSMNYMASDDLLEAIAQGCKQLRSLHIEFSGVSGEAVVSLCRELPHLSDLNVAGCRHLTDDDLIKCIANAKNLKMLDVSYCQVSSALVAAAAYDVSRRPRTFRVRLTCSLRNIDKKFQEEKRLGLVISRHNDDFPHDDDV